MRSLTIGGIPTGAILTDGVFSFTAGADGNSADVTGWNLSNLIITPPNAADFTLTATATIQNSRGRQTTLTATEIVTVLPIAPELTWSAAPSPGTEGAPVALGALSVGVNGFAGDSNSLRSLVISGIPSGALLTDGTNSVTAGGVPPGGAATSAASGTADVTGWNLSNLTITSPNTADFTLTATATVRDAQGNLAAATANETVTAIPVAPATIVSSAGILATVSSAAGTTQVAGAAAGSGYADGAAKAPPGAPQLPNLLSGYASRPSWEVAGVDYAVGPRSTPTKDPSTINMAGVTVNTSARYVMISGDNITLDGYDFSLHGGYYAIVTGNNDTITNSNFVMGSNTAPYLVQGYGNNLTLNYDIFDGTATTDNQSGLIGIYGTNPVIQYDWLKNYVQHALEMTQALGVVTTLDYEFNLIQNGGLGAGSHLNFLQWAHGTAVNPIVAFNTTYQTQTAANGEGFQFDGYSDSTIKGAVFNNNTMITAPSGGSVVAMSYPVHLLGGGSSDNSTGVAQNNWFDTSSAYGAFYPVDNATMWSLSSNYYLGSGTSVPVSGTTEAHAPGQPVISGATPGNGAVTVNGTAEAGSTVSVFDAIYNLLGTTTADSTGKWTFASGTMAGGSHSITAVAADTTGASVASSAVSVSVSAGTSELTVGTRVPIAAIAGKAFSGTVANFTDSNPGVPETDLTATINWGDGTTSAGTVTDVAGAITVAGTHTFAATGTDTVTVVLNDPDGGGAATATTSATVTSSYAGSGSAVTVKEGAVVAGAVATFTDANTADTASGFTATIAWGDGTTSAGTVTGANGSFSVAGASGHSYTAEGSYVIATTVTHTADKAGLALSGSATVTDADVFTIVAPAAISGTAGQSYSGVVGTFTDAYTGTPASDMAATIVWGDGATSTGTVTAVNGAISVTGTHTFAVAGNDTVLVTLTDVDGTAKITASGTATIAAGSGGTPVPPAPPTPQGTSGFADGSAAAAPGTPQMPTLLSGYASRPSWEVAGVDYAVGPRSTPAKDPSTINMAGVDVDTTNRIVRITADNVTLDGYDFSLHGGYYVIVTGNNDTITNSNFVMGSNTASYLVQAYGDGLTLNYNTFDGTATTDNQSALIAIYGSNPVIQYNWLKNFVQHAVEMNQSLGVVTTLDYEFNLIQNGGLGAGSHLNYLQWAHGTAVNPIVAFNTTYQTQQVANGEGFQFDGYDDSSITGAVFNNNTMITAPSGGSVVAISYAVHLLGGGVSDNSTGVAQNNWVDTSSAYGAFYPVDTTAMWSLSSNYNLGGGTAVAVSGTTEAHAPGQPVISGATASGGKVTVTGTAEASSTVSVYDATYVLCGTTTADATGKWTFTSGTMAAGSHAITAVAADATGISVASKAFTVAVGGGATTVLTAGGAVPVATTAGVGFNGTVAKFTDSNTTDADLSATINWGDGTTSAGVVANAAGAITVTGSHTYAATGSDNISVVLTDPDGGSSATATTKATVATPYTGKAGSVSVKEGTAVTGAVATFTDLNTADAASAFAATIAWGDGTTSAGTVTGAAGSFSVSGASGHVYTAEGNFTISTTVTHTADNATLAMTSAATVTDADVLIAGSGLTIAATAGQAYLGTVATFTDSYSGAKASDLTATITWGDGTTSVGAVTAVNGAISVTGTHTYAAAGTEAISVTLADIDGTATATASTTANVAVSGSNPPLSGQPAGPPTYNLTTGADTISGLTGNDIITATANTLSSGDLIDAGAGTNTLQLAGGGGFNLALPSTLANIQNVAAQEGAGTAAQTVTLRGGTHYLMNVAADPTGNPAAGITIYGAQNTDVITLGAGNDTVVLGLGETVNGGGGNAVYKVTSSTITDTINGGTAGTNTLAVIGGGGVTMGVNITGMDAVQLAAPTTFTANATANMQITGNPFGGDTITVGAASQSVVAGGPNDRIKATAANAGASVSGLFPNDTLEITTGGTAVLNAVTRVGTVVLDAATKLTLSKMSFVAAVGSSGNDTITAQATWQTLTGGAGTDSLVGFTGGYDTFSDKASGLNGDTIRNFVSSDRIDITDLVPASAVLKVTALANGNTRVALTSGATKATFTLAGSYSAGGFTLAADGNGGTLLTHS